MTRAIQNFLIRIRAFLFLCVLLGIASVASASERMTVAILPPHNKSGDTNDEHWRYTIPMLLEEKLMHVKSILICPESSRDFAYRELKLREGDDLQAEDAKKIGQVAEARWVAFGDYRQEGTNWTMTLQLINAATGKVSQRTNASAPARMQVIEEIAEDILQDTGAVCTDEERVLLKQNLTTSEQALELSSRAYAAIRQARSLAYGEEIIRQAIALDPKSAFFQAGLSRFLELENKLQGSEDAAQMAVNLSPDYYRAHRALAYVYQAEGLLHLARSEALEAIRLCPASGELYVALADINLQLGYKKEVLEDLNLAETLDPFSCRPHVELGFLHGFEGDREKALKEIQMAEHYFSGGDPSEEQGIAYACDKINEIPKAIEYYEKYLAETKDADIALPLYVTAKERLAALKASLIPHYVSAEQPRDYTPAELESALKERLTPSEYASITNPLYCTPEMAAWAKQLTEEAKGPEEKARKLFEPFKRRVYHEHAWSERTASEVFTDWNKEGENFICQENALLYMALAKSVGLNAYYVYVTKGPNSNVIDHACVGTFINGKALLLDPSYRWFGVPHLEYHFYNDLETVGIFTYQTTNLQRLRTAIKIIPDSAEAHFWLSAALRTNGKGKEAREELEKGLKLDPRSWHGLTQEGWLEGDKENWQFAVNYLQAALEINPRYGRARYLLGTAFYHLGSFDKAREEYREYLQGEMEPGYGDYARQAISQINSYLQNTNMQAISLFNPPPTIKQ